MNKTTNRDLWEGITRIVVRREDIHSAILYNQAGMNTCPIYHAIKRVLACSFEIKVLRTTVQIFPFKGNKGMYGKLPKDAILFGEMWDADEIVKPFSFDVNFCL